MRNTLIKKAVSLLMCASMGIAASAAAMPASAMTSAEPEAADGFEYDFSMGGSEYVKRMIAENYGEGFVSFYEDVIDNLAYATEADMDFSSTVDLKYTAGDGKLPAGLTLDDKNTIKEILLTLIYDNPQFYWIGDDNTVFSSSYSSSGSTLRSYTVKFVVNPEYRSAQTRQEANDFLKEDVDRFYGILSEKQGEFFKLAALNDTLCGETKYDVQRINPDNATLLGCLRDNVCVCDGYSKAFMFLSNTLGIADTVKATTRDHAWNAVELDGEWFYIDVTFNDVIFNGSVDNDNSDYWRRYFLKSFNTFVETDMQTNKDGTSEHLAVGKLYNIMDLPEISENDYVYSETIDLKVPDEFPRSEFRMTAKPLDFFNKPESYTLDGDRFGFEGFTNGRYLITFACDNCVQREYEVTVINGAPSEPVNVQLNAIGDATLDGKINSLDILAIKREMIAPNTLKGYSRCCADAYGNDGKLSSMDIISLKRHMIHYLLLW